MGEAGEGPIVLHTHFCGLSNIQMVAPAQHFISISCKGVCQIYRDKEQPQEKETS